MLEYETRILKRWKTLSFLQTLRLNGIIRMMIISCLIFFKYRIVNKMVVIITIKKEEDKPEEQKQSLFVSFCRINQNLGLFSVGKSNSIIDFRLYNLQIPKRSSLCRAGIIVGLIIGLRTHINTNVRFWGWEKQKFLVIGKPYYIESSRNHSLHLILHGMPRWKARQNRDARVKLKSYRYHYLFLTRVSKPNVRTFPGKPYW